MNLKKPRLNVSLWLRITSYILIGVGTVLEYFSLLAEGYPPGARTVGASAVFIIGGLIGIACGNKCSKWAIKIKSSPNIAYAFGFIFSLLGLLFYWLHKNEKQRNETKIKI